MSTACRITAISGCGMVVIKTSSAPSTFNSTARSSEQKNLAARTTASRGPQRSGQLPAVQQDNDQDARRTVPRREGPLHEVHSVAPLFSRKTRTASASTSRTSGRRLPRAGAQGLQDRCGSVPESLPTSRYPSRSPSPTETHTRAEVDHGGSGQGGVEIFRVGSFPDWQPHDPCAPPTFYSDARGRSPHGMHTAMRVGLSGSAPWDTHMARNLHRAGCSPRSGNRTAEKARSWRPKLGVQLPQPLSSWRRPYTVVSCVSADADVLEVARDLAAGLTSGTLMLDCSTIGAETAARRPNSSRPRRGIPRLSGERGGRGRPRRHARHHGPGGTPAASSGPCRSCRRSAAPSRTSPDWQRQAPRPHQISAGHHRSGRRAMAYRARAGLPPIS